MTRLIGIINGKTIELDNDPGLPTGKRVVVEVWTAAEGLPPSAPVGHLPGPPPGWRPTGGETAAGSLADSWTDDDDRHLMEIREDLRRASIRELPP